MNNTINRLIIIGNGFDLAHGMKTKYKDFVNGYLRQRIESCFEKDNTEDSKDLVKIEGESKNLSVYKEYLNLKALLVKSKTTNGLDQDEKMLLMILYKKLPRQFQEKHPTINDKIIWRYVPDIVKDCKDNEIHLTQGIIQLIEKQKVYPVSYTPFFKKVYDEIENKNWVDIECAYYEYLCGLMKKLDLSDEEDTKKEVSKEIDELNEEMKCITRKLVEYLRKQNEEYKKINEFKTIYEFIRPLKRQEIAVNAEKYWKEFVVQRENNTTYQDQTKYFQDTKKFYVEPKYQSDDGTDVYKLFPGKVFLLNFNYTTYIEPRFRDTLPNLQVGSFDKDRLVCHIHGDLNDENSIIFGYGDDSDEMYKKLLDKNNNRFLENDKTVKYLGSARYRNFFGFIESAPFQVCIMGHSCGISDRTLLSTIFQHENCVSIKPYFYKNGDNNDYYEIIKNISRCFDDKKLMRDRVVNKDYCEPLPQPGKNKNR